MTRFPDWQSRLHRFLEEHRNDKFSYGKWDCALFVCDAIASMTGEDPAESFRGQYSSRTEALSAVKAYAGSNSIKVLAERVTMERSMRPILPTFAGRGDVVLLRRGKRDASLGIVALNGRAVEVVTPHGLQHCSFDLVIQAWRV